MADGVQCIILSVRRNNPSHNYFLNDTPVSRSDFERNIGVLVSSDLCPGDQSIQARI